MEVVNMKENYLKSKDLQKAMLVSEMHRNLEAACAKASLVEDEAMRLDRAGRVAEAAEGYAEDVADWASGAAEDVADWTAGAAEDVGEWGEGAWEDVAEWGEGAAEWTEGAWEDTVDWFEGAGEDIADFVTDLF